MTFAFTKATDGLHTTDKTFSTNWIAMKTAGLIRGAYHFAHPRHDAVDQATRFFKVVQPTSGDLQLVLDLEVNDGKKPAAVWAWAQAFLAEIERLSGRPAIFYSYGPFWKEQMGNPKDNLNCPLWLADYRHTAHVPHAWTDWTFWQYTEKGTVAGVQTHVDLNHFQGTLAQLKQLTFS
jgi:GH25 family lysozyme M1 (1,4-beta-N-acetylmuramidase)